MRGNAVVNAPALVEQIFTAEINRDRPSYIGGVSASLASVGEAETQAIDLRRGEGSGRSPPKSRNILTAAVMRKPHWEDGPCVGEMEAGVYSERPGDSLCGALQ